MSGRLRPPNDVHMICLFSANYDISVLSQLHTNRSCLEAFSCMSDFLHVSLSEYDLAVICASILSITLLIFCHMGSSSKCHFSMRLLRMWLRAAVVAAHGGDELLHAVLGAAVAGGPRLVYQRGVLLAGPHAYAGASPAAFHSACLYHGDHTAIIQLQAWVCFMLFIPACILQTHVVGIGQVHAAIHATRPAGMILVPHHIWKTLLPFGHGCKHVWMWWLCTPAPLGAGDMGAYQLSACCTSQRWDFKVRVNQMHLFEHSCIYCQEHAVLKRLP